MRVIKYPEPEQETIITCSKCGAELAYVNSDCYWKNGVASDLKYIVCPICKTELIIKSIPYPGILAIIGKPGKEFRLSDSWAEETKS